MNSSRAGMSMIEALVATAIFTTVLGAGLLTMRSGQRSFDQTVTGAAVNAKASRALNRIARHLTGARQLSVVISPDAERVSFQEVAGWVDRDPVWSTDSEVRFEYAPGELDNGLDDDGNGFVDDGRVVVVENVGQPDERTTTYVNFVREFLEGEVPNGADDNGNGLDDERGLCFELQGDALVIRLTVQRMDPENRVVLRTLTTTVGMRN